MNKQNRGAVILLGVFVLLALLSFTWLSIEIGGWSGVGPNYYKAKFNNVTGLVPQSDVKMAGISIGKVATLELSADEKAEIVISLEHNLQIRKGTRAIIKSKSLLGEMFLELQPGPVSAPALPHGEYIQNTVSPLRIADLGEIIGPFADSLDPQKVQIMLDNIFGFVGENQENFQLASNRIMEIVEVLNGMVVNNESRVNRILGYGDEIGAVFQKDVASHSKEMVEAVVAVGRAADGIEKITHHIDGMVLDSPESLTDATALLHELRGFVRMMNQENLLKAIKMLKVLLQRDGFTVNLLKTSGPTIDNEMEQYRNILNRRAGSANTETETTTEE